MPYLHKYRILPLLVYLSLMNPVGWWFWLGLMVLAILCSIKSEYNFLFIAAIPFVLLPSLYTGSITWSYSIAVLMAYPLTLGLSRFNDTSALFYSLLWLAMLSFFAGPLAPIVIIVALLIYLPRKAILPSVLIFMILLALPLGRTDWKTWLGQSGTPIQRSWDFDHGTPVQEEVQGDAPLQPDPVKYGWTDMLNQLYLIMLFVMYALMLALMVRLFWQMRYDKKKILRGFMTLFLLILGGSLLIPIHRWIGTHSFFQGQNDAIPTSPLLPEQPVVPGGEKLVPTDPALVDPLPVAPTGAQNPLFDLIAQSVTILMILAMIGLTVWFIRKYWSFPLQSDKDEPQPFPKISPSVQSPKPDWSVLSSGFLVETAYKTLRKQRFATHHYKTPLELKKAIKHPAFQKLTDVYVLYAYQLKSPEVEDKILRQWVTQCFTEL